MLDNARPEHNYNEFSCYLLNEIYMMKSLRILLILGLSFLFLFGGCVKAKHPGHQIEYYTLEYEPPSSTDLEPLPYVVRIERFGVAPNYNTSRIIYREGSFRRKAYIYKRWRSNPGELVTYFLRRDIKDSGLFRAALPHDSRFPSSFVIEGSVDEFFEWDTTTVWTAVLTLSITLMAEAEPDISKRILLQKTYQVKEACRSKNPAALAEAMSRAMARVSGEIIKDLYARIKEVDSKG